MVDCSSYNMTTYIATKIKGKEKKKRKEKRRKIYYSEIITELLLLSDFFMKEKTSELYSRDDMK